MNAADVVIARDRFLYKVGGDGSNNENNNNRFLMKGIAFPDPPPLKPHTATPDNPHPPKPGFNYNATAWIAILQQLRKAVPHVDALNTVRIYRMDPRLDYSEFFTAAAELGFYILVPLTSVKDEGAILNRALKAPDCYPASLLEYGQQAWRNYGRYPNVLAGVIGNEVMNDMDSWYAAPCVKAYARDLQTYMREFASSLLEEEHVVVEAATDEQKEDDDDSINVHKKMYENRTFDDKLLTLPLLYAAQHSGIGAALTETDTIRLTVDYLTCYDEDDDDDDSFLDIDIFGINVESWCSTYDTFQYNQDGSIGAYYQLYQGLYNGIHASLVFSELGCSHLEFDRDNTELRTPEGTRDWHQVPVVLHEMNTTFSGFSAYAYWGNSLFNMMDNGPWDGKIPLEPAQDFINFQMQLLKASSGKEEEESPSSSSSSVLGLAEGGRLFHDLPMAAGGIMDDYYHNLAKNPETSPSCSQVQDVLRATCNLKLTDMSEMPSQYYYQRHHPKVMDDERDDDTTTGSVFRAPLFFDTVAPTAAVTVRTPLMHRSITSHQSMTSIIGMSLGFFAAFAFIIARRTKLFRERRSRYEAIP